MSKTSKRLIIGVVHLPPLLGYADFPGYKVALSNAKKDVLAFEEGGVDAVIIENNYDIPHVERVENSVAICFAKILGELQQTSKIPLGISVLWNDYKTALALAVTYDCDFIRVPVFVDRVESSYGVMQPVYKELTKIRRNLKARNVKILADIHVKHSKILSKHSLTQSALMAIKYGANGIIVTGKWTGDAPSIDDVIKLSKLKAPIYLGSGISADNIENYLPYVTGVIVSTSLKKNTKKKDVINVKPYSVRISSRKVAQLRRKMS